MSTVKLNSTPTIISLGGNAIIRRGESGTIEEQFANAERAAACIAGLAAKGPVIVTHGNGPIVGNILIQNEAARDAVPPMPLYICDADSEGGIGFMIQQTLHNELRKNHSIEDVVAVVTQVVVDPADSAFNNPTKPVGPYFSDEDAERLIKDRGWEMAEAPDGGYRRVVPSPRPIKIIESKVIRDLALSGVVVIAAGGGGVPVVEATDGTLKGIDAVVDKDLATSLLGREVGAKLFIDLTDVDQVCLDYGTATEKPIDTMTIAEASAYLSDGHFPAGSMGPKVEAAIEFIEGGGDEVIITSPELVEEALVGKAGTRIKG